MSDLQKVKMTSNRLVSGRKCPRHSIQEVNEADFRILVSNGFAVPVGDDEVPSVDPNATGDEDRARIAELVQQNMDVVTEYIGGVTDVEELHLIAELEAESKDRSGVLEALSDRLEELEGE